MDLKNNIAIVTGASKGIGYEIAEISLKAGLGVFICARDKFELKRALERLSEFGKTIKQLQN